MQQKLIFGSNEASAILKQAKDAEQRDKGEVSHEKAAEMAAIVYSALLMRSECDDCGGNGGHHIEVNGETEWEECDCSKVAQLVIDKLFSRFEAVSASHLGVSMEMIRDDGFIPLHSQILHTFRAEGLKK